MLEEFQFGAIPVLTMPNSDQNVIELKNSSIPAPVADSILKTTKINLHSVSKSTEESGDETDQDNDGLKILFIPASNSPTGSPITIQVSNFPKVETQGSGSCSTVEVRKRRRCDDGTDQNDGELKNSKLPSSNFPIRSLYDQSIPVFANFDIPAFVSLCSDEVKKQRCLGDEIDQNDDGFTTPTDPDHKIPTPAQCPPAPRKHSWRKSKSPPETASETRRSIFPVDASDDEAESLFPPSVGDELGAKRARRDDDVA